MSVHPPSRPFRQGYSTAAYGSMPLALLPEVVSRMVSLSDGPLRMTTSSSDFHHHCRHCTCGGRK
jgi:hypothetical protein